MKIVKLFITSLIIVLTFTLSSCTQIKDTNGDDDYTIETLSDELLFDSINKYVMIGSFSSHNDNKHIYKMSIISGVKELHTFDNNKYFTIDTKVEVKSGNVKLVLVDNTNILKEFAINDIDTFTFDTSSSIVRLMLMAESANVSIEYLIS